MRPVFEYMDYRKYLKDAFEERKLADARLSYRNLAESLGLDGSNLHKILQGRSHLPARCQSRSLKFLGLGNREAEYFLLLIAYARERGAKARMEILEQARLLQDVPRKALEERECCSISTGGPRWSACSWKRMRDAPFPHGWPRAYVLP